MSRASFLFAIRAFLAAVLSFACVATAHAQQVSITSPTNGSTYAPGSTINVTATVTGGVVIGVKVGAQDMGMTTYQLTAPYTLSLPVPSKVIGPRNLVAVGLIANETIVFSPPVSVDIEPSAIPTAINFQQSLVAFGYAGQQQRVGVTATFADGSTLDITKSTQLTFASANPSLVSVDSTGLMTGLAPGTGSVTASYQGLNTTLQTVGPTGVKGDLNGDGLVTREDLFLLELALGNTPTGPNDARDINGDGKIDSLDLQALLTACGSNCPALGATTTSLAPSASQVQYTHSITFTSTVTGTAAPPTGSVSFVVDGLLGDVGTLSTTGQTSMASNSLKIGPHTVTALYTGDGSNAPSSSPSVAVTVVAVTGDANGDGEVNCLDLYAVKAAFGKRTGQPGFNPSADLNHDGIVNVLDLSIVSRAVPVGTTCP